MYDEEDERASYHHRKSFTTYERPRHSEQRPYHDNRRHNQYRNSIHNDGFVPHRGNMGRRQDAFNNWKPSREDKTERWKENHGRGVYERREQRHDDFAQFSMKNGPREHDRRQNSHRHDNGWKDEPSQEIPNEEALNSSEPVVDEWGREVRNHKPSPSDDDGQGYQHFQARASEQTRYGNGYHDRSDRHHNMKKRRREEADDNERGERWNRGTVQTSSNFGNRTRSRTPPKKPRMERSPPPQFQEHSYQQVRSNYSNEHSHDRTQQPAIIPSNSVHQHDFGIPAAPRALSTPLKAQKGVYIRDPNRTAHYPPASSLATQQATEPTPVIPQPAHKRPVEASSFVQKDKKSSVPTNPPVSKPISFKLAKPEKSALVKKFFMDDEDEDETEDAPVPPPKANPTDRTQVVQADPRPPAQELKPEVTGDKVLKSHTTPKLPPSPISRPTSSFTPVDSIPTEAVEDAAMDISPVDSAPNSLSEVKTPKPALPLSNSSNLTPSAPRAETPKPDPPVVEEPFEFLDLVGAGSYGKVFKTREVSTGKLVALKKIRMEGQLDGFPVTALREIKLLQSLRHENVVPLQEMVVRKGSVFLSFEYVEHDLAGLLKQTEFTLKGEHIKSLAQQLCEGLAYIHGRSVLHRDLKSANLLVTSAGVLKLADFGLARFFNKRKAGRADYTNRVCTQFYRPPELMLGETVYGPEVDMWSAGCIFMELFLKKVPFHAQDEIDQLHLVYSILGSPTSDYAPMLMQKPWYSLILPMEGCVNCFREEFKILPEDALNFAERLLHMDGTQRPSAAEALQDPYFTSDPLPLRPDLTIIKADCHEFEAIRVDKESIKERERQQSQAIMQAKAQMNGQVALQSKPQSKQPPPKKHSQEVGPDKKGQMLPPERRTSLSESAKVPTRL